MEPKKDPKAKARRKHLRRSMHPAVEKQKPISFDVNVFGLPLKK